MFNIIKLILLVSLSSLSIAATQETVKNDNLSCTAKHLDTDKEVDVKIISSIPGKKVATAQWPLGYPTIAINHSAFTILPKNAKQFVYYHECAHLRLKSYDENEADCESIRLLEKRNNYSEIDIRKLIQTLTKEFGWSKRWNQLLDCGNTS